MKKAFLFLSIAFCFLTFSTSALAQKPVATPAVQRDLAMETDSLRDLDVAWQYFKSPRNAYKGVLLRTEVILAAYPDFSKIEDVLYLTGMSSYYLSVNKGKQKRESFNEAEKKKYAPEKMREDAGAYLTQLLKQFPNTKYKSEAEKTLKLLEAAK